jgi:hypothetical protein
MAEIYMLQAGRSRTRSAVSTKYRCHQLCHLQMSLGPGAGRARSPRRSAATDRRPRYGARKPHPQHPPEIAFALHGEAEQAAAELTEAQRLDANYSSIAKLKLSLSRDQSRGARPEIRALFETTYLAGLRKAGMPEK